MDCFVGIEIVGKNQTKLYLSKISQPSTHYKTKQVTPGVLYYDWFLFSLKTKSKKNEHTSRIKPKGKPAKN